MSSDHSETSDAIALRSFVGAMSEDGILIKEQVIGLVWYRSEQLSEDAVSLDQLWADMSCSGHAAQNKPRLRSYLNADRRVIQRNGGFAISPAKKVETVEKFRGYSTVKRLRNSDALLPSSLFMGTRGYIEKVVLQINISFEEALFDGCAVLCRRLLETLIIEVFEATCKADDIKGSDGHYFMFSGLLTALEQEKKISLSRNASKGLKDFKRLGDLSAHNRRYNAVIHDIDRVRDGIRVACEELLHIADLMIAENQ